MIYIGPGFLAVVRSDADFLPIPGPRSRMPDPGSKNLNKTERGKNFLSFLFSQNWKKLYYFWNAEEEKIGPVFKKL